MKHSNATIKVTSPSFSKNKYLVAETQKYFPNAVFNTRGREYSRSELIEYLHDADGAIIGLDRVDDATLTAAPRLKMLSKYGVGLDNIDLEACARRGISIGWTGGLNKRSVSEQTLAFMISLLRNVYLTSHQLKGGNWNKSGGAQLTGKKVGIIGMGYVGKDLVSLLEPFKCEILANDIIDQSEYYRQWGIVETSKEQIYQSADIVTLHVPLTQPPQEHATYHLINEGTLKMMKRSAFLINTSRGRVVDQGALKQALQQSTIAGAALDVYEVEPPQDREFLSLPNLICTPHIGGGSLVSITAMGKRGNKHLFKIFHIGDFTNSS